MQRVMSATEARVHFGEVLRRVTEDGDAVVIERTGRPKAVIISLAEYERLGGSSDLAVWLAEVDQMRTNLRATHGRQPLPDVDELIDAGRDEWLDDLINDLH